MINKDILTRLYELNIDTKIIDKKDLDTLYEWLWSLNKEDRQLYYRKLKDFFQAEIGFIPDAYKLEEDSPIVDLMIFYMYALYKARILKGTHALEQAKSDTKLDR